MEASDKSRHQQTGDHRDCNRGNGVGIKHLQQLNITGDDRNQVSPVLSLQLCRTELPQRRKYLVPDDRQQLKCNIVVAFLFKVVENSPKQCHHRQHRKKHRKARQKDGEIHWQLLSDQLQNAHGRHHRQKRSTKIANYSHDHRKKHDRHQRLYQPNKTGHNRPSRSTHNPASSPP